MNRLNHVYFASGVIAFSFLVIIVSNRTYIAPAERDREIAPTVDAGISIALAIHSFDGRDLEIAPTVDAGITIALAIHSFDPLGLRCVGFRDFIEPCNQYNAFQEREP